MFSGGRSKWAFGFSYICSIIVQHLPTGDNSFVVASATLWNALPNNIKMFACLANFKSHLETHFF